MTVGLKVCMASCSIVTHGNSEKLELLILIKKKEQKALWLADLVHLLLFRV